MARKKLPKWKIALLNKKGRTAKSKNAKMGRDGGYG
jgi:hypothetical protein